jgi:phage terminase large subunit
VTGLIPMQLYRNPRTNTTQQFIPALLEDNPSLFKGDPGYATRLEGMEDQALAKALRWGDWSGLEGQYFDEFDLERDDKPYHRIPVEMPRELDQVFGSMDWGHSPDAFCYHLHLVRKIPWEAGYFLRVITFAEIYGFKKHPAEWADIIRNLEGTFKVVMRYGDPSAWNKDPKGGSSIAEEFLDKGIPFVKANNDRHQGWQAMRVWLGKAPDGLPYWQICSCCKNLINQIPDLERDPLDSFDVLEGGEDHAPDSARYFLISRPMNIAQPTPAKKIQGVTLTVNELLAMGKETKVTSVGQFAVKQ